MFRKRYEDAEIGYLKAKVKELEEKYFSLLMLLNQVGVESGLSIEWKLPSSGHYEVSKKCGPEKGE